MVTAVPEMPMPFLDMRKVRDVCISSRSVSQLEKSLPSYGLVTAVRRGGLALIENFLPIENGYDIVPTLITWGGTGKRIGFFYSESQQERMMLRSRAIPRRDDRLQNYISRIGDILLHRNGTLSADVYVPNGNDEMRKIRLKIF